MKLQSMAAMNDPSACNDMNNQKRMLSSSSTESTPLPPQKRLLLDDIGPRIQAALSGVASTPNLAPSIMSDMTSIIAAVIAAVVPIIQETVQVSIQRALEDATFASNAETYRLNDELLNQAWKVDANEQYSRRENIRISGIVEPSTDGYETPCSTNQIVINTCKKMGVEITDRDISTSHWLPGKRKTIIAKFVRRDTKTEIMKKKNELKTKDPKIHVTEDLTRARHLILREIRDDPNIVRAFTRDGNIRCVIKDGYGNEKTVTIKTPDDMKEIGWSDDDIRWLYPFFT